MNRKRQRSKQLLKRREPNQFVAPVLEDIFTSPAIPRSPSKAVSRAQEIIVEELNRFRLELHRLFVRATQRMLLVAAKEVRPDSSSK